MTREERRARRERFKAGAKSPNTLKAYRHAWSMFERWCEAGGIDPLAASPNDCADHIAELAEEGKARQTILARRNGMRWHYKQAGVADPTAHRDFVGVLEGVTKATTETKGQAAALRRADADTIYRWNPGKIRAGGGRWVRRGKTAIRVMRDAMLRVSEAAALDWADVRWPEPDPVTGEADDAPARIVIRRSKTDQLGRGVLRSVSPATVNALRIWAVVSGAAGTDAEGRLTMPASGSVFGVGGHCLAADISKLAKGAGVVPEGKHVSSHSCRIGMTVDLYVGAAGDGIGAGMQVEQIRVVGRWKSNAMVRYYLREFLGELDPLAETFSDPLAATFGS